MSTSLVEYLLRLGDDRLVLGHRLSEWCGHGPILEEDIALANTALDFIGQANLWLGLAGTVEGQGRDADALAYLRDAIAFRNCRIRSFHTFVIVAEIDVPPPDESRLTNRRIRSGNAYIDRLAD